MKKNTFYLSSFLLVLSFASFTSVQLEAQSFTMDMPRVSQSAAVEQRVGVTDLRVEYHRPAMKGRKIWGGIVPYNGGKPFPWRAGANDNTVFETSTDIQVEGETLKKGRYGIHMIPSENEVEVIFSSNSTSWGSFSYNASEDVLRVKSELVSIDKPVEYLTFHFANPDADKVQLELLWGEKKVVVDISVDNKELVFNHISNQLRNTPGFTWLGLHEGAQYCLNNEIHIDRGFNWANRSVRANPNFRNIIVYATLDAKVNHADKDENIAIVNSLDALFKSQPQNIGWREYNVAALHCLQNNVELDKGLEFINASLEKNETVQGQLNKSILLAKTGKAKEANKLRETALEKASNSQLNAFGYSLLNGGMKKESLEIFEANAKKNPSDPNVFDSLGEAYYMNGKMDKAKDAFTKSLSLNPPAQVKANTLKYLGLMGVEEKDL